MYCNQIYIQDKLSQIRMQCNRNLIKICNPESSSWGGGRLRLQIEWLRWGRIQLASTNKGI
jgi:hypothetical protein